MISVAGTTGSPAWAGASARRRLIVWPASCGSRVPTFGPEWHNVVLTLLATGGVVGVLTEFYPGIVLFAAAAALALAQRSTLALAIRTPDSNRRRRRLGIAAFIGATFMSSQIAFYVLVGDSWTMRETLLALVGVPSMFGGIVFFIAGLLTPRTPDNHGVAPSA